MAQRGPPPTPAGGTRTSCPALHRRERLPAGVSRRPRRPHLPLLPQQSHRRGDDAGRAQAVVKYAHAHEAAIVYDAAYDRTSATPTIPRSIYEIDGTHMVAWVAQLLEDRRVHRDAPRVRGRAAGGAGDGRRRTARSAWTSSGSGGVDKVERGAYVIQAPPRPCTRRKGKAGAGADRLLHGQRAGDSRGARSRRPHGLRRAQRPTL